MWVKRAAPIQTDCSEKYDREKHLKIGHVSLSNGGKLGAQNGNTKYWEIMHHDKQRSATTRLGARIWGSLQNRGIRFRLSKRENILSTRVCIIPNHVNHRCITLDTRSTPNTDAPQTRLLATVVDPSKKSLDLVHQCDLHTWVRLKDSSRQIFFEEQIQIFTFQTSGLRPQVERSRCDFILHPRIHMDHSWISSSNQCAFSENPDVVRYSKNKMVVGVIYPVSNNTGVVWSWRVEKKSAELEYLDQSPVARSLAGFVFLGLGTRLFSCHHLDHHYLRPSPITGKWTFSNSFKGP